MGDLLCEDVVDWEGRAAVNTVRQNLMLSWEQHEPATNMK
jgi:hypothetical protein